MLGQCLQGHIRCAYGVWLEGQSLRRIVCAYWRRSLGAMGRVAWLWFAAYGSDWRAGVAASLAQRTQHGISCHEQCDACALCLYTLLGWGLIGAPMNLLWRCAQHVIGIPVQAHSRAAGVGCMQMSPGQYRQCALCDCCCCALQLCTAGCICCCGTWQLVHGVVSARQWQSGATSHAHHACKPSGCHHGWHATMAACSGAGLG